MHIYDDKVYFSSLANLFCALDTIWDVLLLLCVHVSYQKSELVSEWVSERDEGVAGDIKGINKKSFLFAKYFHIQTSTKKGEKKNEKMLHSAMH